jgi:hypothetical protein
MGKAASRLNIALSAANRRLAMLEKEVGMLLIGHHPHLISVPHRIHELDHMLDVRMKSRDVGFYTGSERADWFIAASPAPQQV